MTDGHGTQPALRLHGLTGIVDDERINHRQWTRHGLGPALGGKRQRLARQPLQRAVGAEMNQRVDLRLLSQPGIERHIGVARGNGRVVIASLAITRRPTVWLEKHQQLSGFEHGKRKSIVFGRRVGSGITPNIFNLVLQRRRQRLQPCRVIIERNVEASGMSREQPLDISSAQFLRADIIASRTQKIDDLNNALSSVEPHGITGTPRASWIIR